MDPINQNDQNSQDLSKQYQDILDRYAKDLAEKSPAPTENTPPAPPVPPVEPAAPEIVIPEPETEPSLPPEPIIEIAPPVAPESLLANSELPPFEPEAATAAPANPVFKYIFYLSLFIFLGVCGAIGYNVYSNLNKPSSNNNVSTDTIPTVAPVVTSVATDSAAGSICNLNDQNYSAGQTFASADGCNTCTCNADTTVSCTDKTCSATTSSSLTPTITSKPATTSAVQKDFIYKNTKLGFSLTIPASWTGKYTVVPSTKSVQFTMKDSTTTKAIIFGVESMTDSEWADAQLVPHGTMITRNSVTKKVFVSNPATENPFFDVDPVKADNFTKMESDVKTIISSFTLSK